MSHLDFERFFELSLDMLAIASPEGRFIRVNAAFERCLGWSLEELMGQPFANLIHPDDRPATARELARLAVGQASPGFENRYRAADGRYRTIQWMTTRDIASGMLFAVGRDMTRVAEAQAELRTALDREKQALLALRLSESRLAESNARFEAALDGVAAGFFILDQAWRFRFVNAAGAQMMGRPREQLRDKQFWEEFPDAVGSGFYTLYHQVMATRQPMVIQERYPGLDRWFEVYASPYIGGIAVFFLDITERKRAEEALQVKDQVIISSLNAIVFFGIDGKVSYMNPAFLRLWGYDSEAEVLGKAPPELVVDPTALQQMAEQLRLRGFWQGEITARRKDGSNFDAIVSANTVRDAAGNVVNTVGSVLDISEAKRLQAQLLQAQKMESVGRLAGGVAHDFNNLLTVIKGYMDLAMLDLDPAAPLHYDLSQVSKAVESATGLTQQLLAFSRQQVIAPQVISLNDVVVRLEGILQRVLGEAIELRLLLAPQLPSTRFDPGQCEQILLNLAINARDAMPGGGTLTIETAEVRLGEEYAHLHPDVRPGDYLLLAVSDTGAGMAPEVRAHIFEPFFTTKALGKGTGLGLAMVYGAVSQNGGRIEVYSEPGQGTSFKIYLPRVDGPGAAPRLEPGEALPRGTETILLVEDDDAVRALATQMLEQLSYRVLACSEAGQALEAASALAEPIHLLITDVIMPGLNGRALADRLLELRPAIKVLFTSGYTANVIVHHGVLKEGVEFLAKPYSIRALAQRVRQLLDKRDP